MYTCKEIEKGNKFLLRLAAFVARRHSFYGRP